MSGGHTHFSNEAGISIHPTTGIDGDHPRDFKIDIQK